ncbi:hypothetical protein EPO15_03785 [bacterium]|nr:MAG: hypothetical protein EPO15_03785 [bacterium]
MAPVLILAANAWRELWRARFISVVALFGGVLVYMSLLLGVLAGDVELRVLFDMGLAVVEVMTCGAVAYCAATGLIQEMEQKTLYLILARPVPRAAFLGGRYFGTVAAAGTAAAAMVGAQALLLLAKGWHPGWDLPLAFWGILLKLVVTGAVATLLALISTSVLSAMTMTAIVWVLGHFVGEIRFLAERSAGILPALISPAAYILPNFALLNYRDRLDIPGAGLGEPLLWGFLYAVAYAAVCLGLTAALFRRKEF